MANSSLLHEINSENPWRVFLKDNISRIYCLSERLRGATLYNSLLTDDEIGVIRSLCNNIVKLAREKGMISDRDL